MVFDENERWLGLYRRGLDLVPLRVSVPGAAAAGFQTARPVDSNTRNIYSGYAAGRYVLPDRAEQSHRCGRFGAGSVLG